MEDWKSWQGKKVFIKLKAGREYAGKIERVELGTVGNPIAFITMIDRYGKRVGFASSEIKIIQEEV